MARIEHYYDPQAPRANSIVVAVTAFVMNQEGRVLVIHRRDNDLWALPGGAQEIGEYIAEAVVRETKEEAGIDIEVEDIIGVYTNPSHVVEFSDGEVRQQFSICFRARYLGGVLASSDETSDARWVGQDQLDSLGIHPSMRLRINHGFENRSRPYIG